VIELRRFLGVLNYYRQCIPRAAHDQAILNEYLRDNKKNDRRPIEWSEEANKAFKKCRRILAETALLAHPCQGAPLSLTTDASEVDRSGSGTNSGWKNSTSRLFFQKTKHCGKEV